MFYRPFAARIALVFCALAFAALAPASALAHASLVSTSPAEGVVLQESPSEVRLEFSEPVSPTLIKLFRPDSSAVEPPDVRQAGNAVTVVMPALDRGTHILSWRVTSEDGHPVGGSLVFSVGEKSGGASPGQLPAPDPGLAIAIWIGRIAIYLAAFLGVGAVAFGAFIAPLPRRLFPFVRALLALGLVAVVASVGLQGLDLRGAGVDSLGDSRVWSAGFTSTYGTAAAILAAAFILALVVSGLHSGPGQAALAALAMTAVGVGFASTGHASAADPQMLTRPAVFLHTLGVTFWAGSLVPLLLLVAAGDHVAPMLRRYSVAVLPVFLVILLTGSALAVIQVQKPEALLATDYGRVLSGKLVLVAIILTLAAVNRLRYTPSLVTASTKNPATRASRRHFAGSIVIEACLACMVFALAATWRFTPPPRALVETFAPPAWVHLHGEKAMAQVVIDPGRFGPVTMSIDVTDLEANPITPKDVTVLLSNLAIGIEPLVRPAAREADGQWYVRGLEIPRSGTWTIQLDVLLTEFQQETIENKVDIR